jgi:hypothetical protein
VAQITFLFRKSLSSPHNDCLPEKALPLVKISLASFRCGVPDPVICRDLKWSVILPSHSAKDIRLPEQGFLDTLWKLHFTSAAADIMADAMASSTEQSCRHNSLKLINYLMCYHN